MVTDEVRDGYWYIEVDTFRLRSDMFGQSSVLYRLRAHAEGKMWRKIEELPSNQIGLYRAVFWPLRPEDV